MFSFLPELTHRASAVLALAVGVVPAAHAAGVPGQGTWETTLQGRDLDGNAATFEAYYDTVLNITWLADGNYAKTTSYAAGDDGGRMTWDEAKTWAAQLNINGVTGWRLPDVKPVNGSSFDYSYSDAGTTDVGFNITSTQSELAHMYHVTLGNKGIHNTSGIYQPDFGMKNTGPFNIVRSDGHWSSVEYAHDSDGAWVFGTGSGYQGLYYKGNEVSAWAVRPGDVAAVPEPEAYALTLAGLAVTGVVARRRRQP